MDESPTLAPPLAAGPNLVLQLESLLFIAGEPIALGQLAELLDVTRDMVEVAVVTLIDACRLRGIRIQRHNDALQMVTAPEAAPVIERYLGVQQMSRLSPAALEALAIIAYRQPVTRAQIDAVRGVDSGSVLRVLLTRELIVESGRLETAGRPILYVTTIEFLRQFGLTSLADLPPFEALVSAPLSI